MTDSSYQANVHIPQGGGSLQLKAAAGPGIVSDNGSVIFNQRFHVATTDVNSGLTLLSAISGYKYRMIGAKAISVGGAAGAVTTVDILATQSTVSAKLVTFAQAALTQSTVLSDQSTSSVVLADGASFIKNDANTAVTIGKTGSSLTTSTFIDVILTYAIEA